MFRYVIGSERDKVQRTGRACEGPEFPRSNASRSTLESEAEPDEIFKERRLWVEFNQSAG